ncbi:MAG TPA: dipeptide epimerase [Stackebrandtia sp.]|jgi:L-alanine-DL-glutamate epimerase-like enolase superfamily enzyme|uniref:mandelate racemase/muconate lactonizing enzyme family protein n=1 Tax=Stackebrandtia sp. TaxID=2023065 RepID=UPI002D2F867C|nr:dipeptide epimerase [Stackebrandtia sp.]HZE39797.1 dipeptide epimerase [Stackebrandtia sp.]
MSITDVSARVTTAPLHTPFVTAVRSTSALETVVVSVTDADGHTGRGEGPQTWRITGESLEGVTACVTGPLRQAVAGGDPDDLNALLDAVDDAVVGNHVAKAAMDVALHDLAAQRMGVPLVRLLGGSRVAVATDVTLSAGQIPELVDGAVKRVAEGFGCLKVKVGADPAGDLARLAAIREAVGSGVVLRVDANQGWRPKEAVRIIRGMEDAGLDIELVEQPTPAHRLDALAFVTSRVDTTILADESIRTLDDLNRVIDTGAADAVNLKLTKCGGLRAGRTILEAARQYGIGTTVGSMMEGPIGIAAAASLAAACGTTAVADLDAAWWLSEPDEALRYSGGELRLADGPGLAALTFASQGDASTSLDLTLCFRTNAPPPPITRPSGEDTHDD